jgi:O-antigen/teichoic acid export membrane protein
LTGTATVLAKGLSVGLSLVTLPLTSRYLGKELYGVWLTLSNFIVWMMIADLGLANSLINALSTADGRDDKRAAQNAVASAFWLVTAIAAALILISVPVVPFIPWQEIFNLESRQSVSELTSAVLVVIIFCALRLPSSIIGCIYQSYQEGYIHQFWSGVSGLLSVAGLVAAIRLQYGLPWLVGAFLGGMLLADLLTAFHLFGRRRAWLKPLPRYFDLRHAKWLLRRGGQFWVAQMSTVLLLQADLIIVSVMFGAGEVAEYGTALRLFTLIGAIQTAFIAPLWPAYGEAAVRGEPGDIEWVSRTFKRSIRISLWWSIPASIAMFLAIPWLFNILTTPDLHSNPHLRLAIMVTEVINSITRCIVVLLNGLGAVRTIAVIGPVSGILNILLSFILGNFIGSPGVAWASAICLSLFWIGFTGKIVYQQLNELRAGMK